MLDMFELFSGKLQALLLFAAVIKLRVKNVLIHCSGFSFLVFSV